MSKKAKKNNGFVGLLENLLLAKSVRHGFLLYFIIFNLDLILTLLGKGHIVKELTNVVPGLMRGEIIGESYKVLEYKSNCSFVNFCISLLWRTILPLACGFFIPIGFDGLQRGSIKARDFVKTKLKINISQDALKEDTNEMIIKLKRDITNMEKEKEKLIEEQNKKIGDLNYYQYNIAADYKGLQNLHNYIVSSLKCTVNSLYAILLNKKDLIDFNDQSKILKSIANAIEYDKIIDNDTKEMLIEIMNDNALNFHPKLLEMKNALINYDDKSILYTIIDLTEKIVKTPYPFTTTHP